jgi:hypothetical protein
VFGVVGVRPGVRCVYVRYGGGRTSCTHTLTDGMYKWRIRTRTRCALGLGWLLGVTVVGAGVGLTWRDALSIAAVSVVIALLVADIYVRHRVPGSGAQEKVLPNESQISRFFHRRRMRRYPPPGD